MLMPSLPPDLKPSMMRPRAGQRNSGVAPDASAWAAVTGSFALGSTLPVGVSSIAGFLPGLAGSALAMTAVLAGSNFAAAVLAAAVLAAAVLAGSALAGSALAATVVLAGSRADLSFAALPFGLSAAASSVFASPSALSLGFLDLPASLRSSEATSSPRFLLEASAVLPADVAATA